MGTTVVIAFSVSGAIFLAALLVTVQLARGRWLQLAGLRAAERKNNPEAVEAVGRTGRRLAVVTGVLCAMVATIALYEAGMQGGNATLANAGLMANNVAFVAFVAAFIWFFIMQRGTRDESVRADTENAEALQRRRMAARMDHLPVALLLTCIGILAAAAGVGMLFTLV